MKTIKLMPEYHSWPLWADDWEPDNIEPYNIDPSTLPLTAQLVERLDVWADIFTSKLNQEDPAESGFSSDEEFRPFEEEGLRLWLELRAQLHPAYQVKYHSLKHGLFDTLEEWERVMK